MVVLLQLIIIGYSSLLQPLAITSLARLLKSSTEKESKSWWYFLLSQISILLTADTSTISFCNSACSFKFGGTSRRPALSGSTVVAPFRKKRRNSRAFGSKSFSLLISAKSGSQLFIGYKLKHFSKPLLITKWSSSFSGNCFLMPAGKRKRPFTSKVASNSPRKPIIIRDLGQV